MMMCFCDLQIKVTTCTANVYISMTTAIQTKVLLISSKATDNRCYNNNWSTTDNVDTNMVGRRSLTVRSNLSARSSLCLTLAVYV